jgi:hypothetical protein
MDAKELIQVAVASEGEQAGSNLSAQYHAMMRAIVCVHRSKGPLDRGRPITREIMVAVQLVWP